MTGCHLETILKALMDTGKRCERVLDKKIRGIHCEAVECDELWSFVQKKQGQVTAENRLHNPEFGDTYTYVGLDPASKLVVAFHVGKRDRVHRNLFMSDLSERID